MFWDVVVRHLLVCRRLECPYEVAPRRSEVALSKHPWTDLDCRKALAEFSVILVGQAPLRTPARELAPS